MRTAFPLGSLVPRALPRLLPGFDYTMLRGHQCPRHRREHQQRDTGSIFFSCASSGRRGWGRPRPQRPTSSRGCASRPQPLFSPPQSGLSSSPKQSSTTLVNKNWGPPSSTTSPSGEQSSPTSGTPSWTSPQTPNRRRQRQSKTFSPPSALGASNQPKATAAAPRGTTLKASHGFSGLARRSSTEPNAAAWHGTVSSSPRKTLRGCTQRSPSLPRNAPFPRPRPSASQRLRSTLPSPVSLRPRRSSTPPGT